MSVLFVAGAGTDVGKTYVTARLIRQWVAGESCVRALKPVVSGVPPIDAPTFMQSDTAMLLGAAGLPVTPETVASCSPWRFAAPLSPDMAAAAEGLSLPFDAVLGWCKGQIATAPSGAITVIEGVGGVMSPIADDGLNLDLIKALRCPVVLVGGSYLGGLSHMLTSLETLKSHGVSVSSVILNETFGSTVEFGASLETLRRFAKGYPIVALRWGEETVPSPTLG